MKQVLIWAAVILLCCTDVKAYNTKQLENLTLAREIGDMFGFPETLQAIILQESSAGMMKLGDDGKSVGLAHVTYGAAVDVLEWCANGGKYCGWWHGTIADNDISIKLVTDNRFNLLVAGTYHQMQYQYFLSKGYSNPWARALISYNAGRDYASKLTDTGIQANLYYQNIMKRLLNIRNFNKHTKVWL